MRGDLILYASSGKLYERAIAFATGGPYVHVAVQVDPYHVIAATPRGIILEDAPPEDANHALVPVAHYAASIGIAEGLVWAKEQIGKEYGWSDIAFQAIKFAWPANPFQFGVKDHWDCADFATRYLQHCGVLLPDDMSDPYTVTPNDLARYFKAPMEVRA